MLYGFIGVQAKENGLNITPKLPSKMLYAQCTDIDDKGTNRTIRVSRGDIKQELSDWDAPDRLSTGTDILSQDFTATSTFNELGVFIGTNRLTDISFDATVYSYDDGICTKVATRRLYPTEDFSWVYFALPSASEQTVSNQPLERVQTGHHVAAECKKQVLRLFEGEAGA